MLGYSDTATAVQKQGINEKENARTQLLWINMASEQIGVSWLKSSAGADRQLRHKNRIENRHFVYLSM